jgi:hypothetical protein
VSPAKVVGGCYILVSEQFFDTEPELSRISDF